MSTETDSSPAKRKTKQLAPETEAWSKAALDAGNRADRDLEYAKEVGRRLF